MAKAETMFTPRRAYMCLNVNIVYMLKLLYKEATTLQKVLFFAYSPSNHCEMYFIFDCKE